MRIYRSSRIRAGARLNQNACLCAPRHIVEIIRGSVPLFSIEALHSPAD
jgi:hypothetical protein